MRQISLIAVMVLLLVGVAGCGAIQTVKESIRDSHTPIAQ